MCAQFRDYSEKDGNFMNSHAQAILAVWIVLIVPAALSGQSSVYPDSMVIDAGIGYTMLVPSLDDLGYSGLSGDETRSVWALWPVVDLRVPVYQLGQSMLKLNLGIQPLFISVLKLSQLNTDDTENTDADYSFYAIAEYAFPVKKGMDFTVGAGFRYHFWTWNYYYDSQIGADSYNSSSGSSLTLSLLLAMDYLMGKTPLRIALMPDLSYGLIMPISISVGFPIGKKGAILK